METRTAPHFVLSSIDPGNGLKVTRHGLAPASRSSARLDLTNVSEGPVPDLAGNWMRQVIHDDLKRAIEATGATGIRFHTAPEPTPALQAFHPGQWHYPEVTGTSPGASRGFHDDHVSFERTPSGMLSLRYPCWDPCPQGWDGSDVYVPDGTGFIVLTERVARAIREAGCTVELNEVGRFSMMATVLDTEDVSGLTEAEEDDLWERVGPGGLWEQRTGGDRETWQGPGYCPDVVRTGGT